MKAICGWWALDSRPTPPPTLDAMRSAWEAWNDTMPPIPADATISLGYSYKDMPQR